jgi:hypothetical protein
MTSLINPFRQPQFSSKQLSFGQQNAQRPSFSQSAAASQAAQGVGVQKTSFPQAITPTAASQGAQALGPNKPQGDELTRFKGDMQTFKGNLGQPAHPGRKVWNA